MKYCESGIVESTVSIYSLFKRIYPLHLSRFSGRRFTVPQLVTLCHIRCYSGVSDAEVEEIVKRGLSEANLSTPESRTHITPIADIWVPRPIRRLPPMTYRGIVIWLQQDPRIRAALELRRVPDHSTLAKFDARFQDIDEAAAALRKEQSIPTTLPFGLISSNAT